MWEKGEAIGEYKGVNSHTSYRQLTIRKGEMITNSSHFTGGKRILTDDEKFGKPEWGGKRTENIAKDVGCGKREIERCIQFARKYPQLSHGVRQLSWREIANELLIENPKEKPRIPFFPDKKYGKY